MKRIPCWRHCSTCLSSWARSTSFSGRHEMMCRPMVMACHFGSKRRWAGRLVQGQTCRQWCAVMAR